MRESCSGQSLGEWRFSGHNRGGPHRPFRKVSPTAHRKRGMRRGLFALPRFVDQPATMGSLEGHLPLLSRNGRGIAARVPGVDGSMRVGIANAALPLAWLDNRALLHY